MYLFIWRMESWHSILSASSLSPVSFPGQKAQWPLQAMPYRQQHSVYVVLRPWRGSEHMLSPSRRCQQISMCTSSLGSRVSARQSEEEFTKVLGRSVKIERSKNIQTVLYNENCMCDVWFPQHKLLCFKSFVYLIWMQLIYSSEMVRCSPLNKEISVWLKLLSWYEVFAPMAGLYVTPSVVLRLTQRRRVLSRTNGGLQKQSKDPAVFIHTPFSQAIPNPHSS